MNKDERELLDKIATAVNNHAESIFKQRDWDEEYKRYEKLIDEFYRLFYIGGTTMKSSRIENLKSYVMECILNKDIRSISRASKNEIKKTILEVFVEDGKNIILEKPSYYAIISLFKTEYIDTNIFGNAIYQEMLSIYDLSENSVFEIIRLSVSIIETLEIYIGLKQQGKL